LQASSAASLLAFLMPGKPGDKSKTDLHRLGNSVRRTLWLVLANWQEACPSQ
jgi:hypothetical protein